MCGKVKKKWGHEEADTRSETPEVTLWVNARPCTGSLVSLVSALTGAPRSRPLPADLNMWKGRGCVWHPESVSPGNRTRKPLWDEENWIFSGQNVGARTLEFRPYGVSSWGQQLGRNWKRQVSGSSQELRRVGPIHQEELNSRQQSYPEDSQKRLKVRKYSQI